MVAHGICYVMSSYAFGWLVKYIGRIGCFITAALLNYTMICLMYFWQPNSSQVIVLYVIASVWAIADAIWDSQVIGILSFCLLIQKID
jgi:predicted MFS family arabinose efflux permease